MAAENRLVVLFIVIISLLIVFATNIIFESSSLIPYLLLALAIPFSFFLLQRPTWMMGVFWIIALSVGPTTSIGIEISDFNLNVTDYWVVLVLITLLTRKSRASKKFSISPFIFGLLAYVIASYLFNPFDLFLADFRLLLYAVIGYLFFRRIFSSYPKEVIVQTMIKSMIIGSILLLVRTIALLFFPELSLDLALDNYGINNTLNYIPIETLGATRITFLGADTLTVVFLPTLFALVIPKQRIIKNFWFAAAEGSLLLSVFLSFTRSDWLGVIAGICLVVILLFIPKQKLQVRIRVILIGVGSLLLLWALMGSLNVPSSSYTVLELLSRRISGSRALGGENSLPYRMEESRLVLEAISDAPLLGKGLGGYFMFQSFGLQYPVPTIWVHSGWIWLLLKSGVVGFCLVLYLFWYSISSWYFFMKNIDNASDELLAMSTGLVGGLLALMTMSLTNNRFASIEGIIFLVFCLSYWKHIRQQTSEPPTPIMETE